MERDRDSTRRRKKGLWKRVLLTVLGIVIVGLVSMVILVTLSTERTSYVTQASLSVPQLEPPFSVTEESNSNARELRQRRRSRCERLLLRKANLAPGHALVLLVHQWDRGKRWAIDDESYKNLAVEIQHPQFNVPVTLPSEEVRLYYSSGGTVWRSQCQGVLGTKATGTFILRQSWFGWLRAELDLTLQVHHAEDLREMEPVRFHGSFLLREQDSP